MLKNAWQHCKLSAALVGGTGLAIISLISWTCDDPIPISAGKTVLWNFCWQQLLRVSLFIFSFYFLILAVRQQYKKTLSSAQDSINLEKEYRDILETELIAFFENFGLSTSDRVSLYKHESQLRHFRLLARHSDNPIYKQTGRGMYPDSEGCISLAMERDYSYFDNIISPDDINAYAVYMNQNCRMPIDVVKSIRMKPRAIAAISIRNRNNHDVLAILVIESINEMFNSVGYNTAVEANKVRERLDRQANRLSHHLLRYIRIAGDSNVNAVDLNNAIERGM